MIETKADLNVFFFYHYFNRPGREVELGNLSGQNDLCENMGNYSVLLCLQ